MRLDRIIIGLWIGAALLLALDVSLPPRIFTEMSNGTFAAGDLDQDGREEQLHIQSSGGNGDIRGEGGELRITGSVRFEHEFSGYVQDMNFAHVVALAIMRLEGAPTILIVEQAPGEPDFGGSLKTRPSELMMFRAVQGRFQRVEQPSSILDRVRLEFVARKLRGKIAHSDQFVGFFFLLVFMVTPFLVVLAVLIKLAWRQVRLLRWLEWWALLWCLSMFIFVSNFSYPALLSLGMFTAGLIWALLKDRNQETISEGAEPLA